MMDAKEQGALTPTRRRVGVGCWRARSHAACSSPPSRSSSRLFPSRNTLRNHRDRRKSSNHRLYVTKFVDRIDKYGRDSSSSRGTEEEWNEVIIEA